jgi:predicted RNase H-like HicB family nuclease
MQYRIYIERDEDGVFVVTCPALPGCVSQGANRDEALANIREAIELYLESLREHGETVPPGVEQALVEAGG